MLTMAPALRFLRSLPLHTYRISRGQNLCRHPFPLLINKFNTDSLDVSISDKLREKVVIEQFVEKHRNDAMRLLLKSFKNDEPMTGGMVQPLTDAHAAPIFDRYFVEPGLRDNVSFVAIERATGRMVGAYVSVIYRRNGAISDELNLDPTNPMIIILDFLDVVGSGVWALLPADVNMFIKNEMASVVEEYRSLKLGGTLKELSIEAGRRRGCQYAVAIATAVQSQRMNDRLGFEILRFINYDDYRVLGKKAFPNLKPPHIRAQLMGKRLP